MNERRARGCTRIDLPAVQWDVDVTRFRVHQGRNADPDLDPSVWKIRRETPNALHQPWWRTPGEDPEGGCPGGWIRCGFIESLTPYLRKRTEGGGRVQNMRTDRCDDRLVLDAVLYFEDCQESRVGYGEQLRAKNMEA